jgi:hypothetical protein
MVFGKFVGFTESTGVRDLITSIRYSSKCFSCDVNEGCDGLDMDWKWEEKKRVIDFGGEIFSKTGTSRTEETVTY